MTAHITGVPLLFIGFLLIINAMWLQDKVDYKDVGVFNLIVGLLAFISALFYGFFQKDYPLSAGGMLFAITYIWIGINALRGAEDQRALGYYCGLVSLTTIPYAYHAFIAGDFGWTFEWITFGFLWFLFYLQLAKKNTNIMAVTIFSTFFVGIEVAVTGWAYLYGYWPFA